MKAIAGNFDTDKKTDNRIAHDHFYLNETSKKTHRKFSRRFTALTCCFMGTRLCKFTVNIGENYTEIKKMVLCYGFLRKRQ